ncbi:hypothetical protein M5K25_010577 [Dendrobium thyrsiflorum]|uniref:Uncharacterized protein n=1 Tax=Dendrobium thyrsiflorum TaxID=117978 RepID=A0ABD0V1J5_DENTH
MSLHLDVAVYVLVPWNLRVPQQIRRRAHYHNSCYPKTKYLLTLIECLWMPDMFLLMIMKGIFQACTSSLLFLKRGLLSWGRSFQQIPLHRTGQEKHLQQENHHLLEGLVCQNILHLSFELAPVVEAPVIDSPPAHFMESSTLPEGADYQSEIFCHIPRFPNTRNKDMRDQSVQFLREVISRLHPGSPKSLDQFMNTVNATLGVLAQVGLESEDMTYLEGLCREAKFYVRRLKSLSIIRTKVSLPDLREKVRIRREAADAAHDKFTKSADSMRRYNQRSASTSAEVDKLSSKIKNLWREIRDSMSCKVDLQAELEGQTRIIERERNRYQICHRALQDAEAALTQASEELHVAETEYQTLAEVMSQLQDLQSRLL